MTDRHILICNVFFAPNTYGGATIVAEEVARAALFLASSESSYINGQALVVDGGLSASHPVVPGRMW